MKKYKKDIIVVFILLIIALGFYLIFHFTNNKTAKVVEIYREDTLIESYSLDDSGQHKLKFDNSINNITIENGSVFMKDANCPDKLCVKQGNITDSGESIICLPHKIVVKIVAIEGK